MAGSLHWTGLSGPRRTTRPRAASPARGGARPLERGPGGPAGGRRAHPWWQAAAGGGIATCALYALLPPGIGRDALYVFLSWSPVAATLVGLRRYRPPQPRCWRLLAAGLACASSGDLLSLARHNNVITGAGAAWSAAGAYLAAFVLLTAAMVALTRARRPARDPGGLLDAVALATALGLLLWTFLIRPLSTSPVASTPVRLFALAYVTGSIVLLALLLRLLSDPSGRGPAYWLLVTAAALALAATLVFEALTLTGRGSDGTAVTAVNLALMLGFTLVDVAALHPSMRRLTTPPPSGEVDALLTRWRLGVLAIATVVTPVALIGQSLSPTPIDSWVLAAGSALMSLLVLVRMAGLLSRVQTSSRLLAELADSDPLTGVPNRRALARQLRRDLARAAREDTALAVAVLDLDLFKAYNDANGHLAGDIALRRAAAVWQRRLRAGDLLARLGGEEFAVVLPGAGLPAALAVAEDLRRATPAGLTVSIGVACHRPGDTDESLLARADDALYDAKREGRNRVRARTADA